MVEISFLQGEIAFAVAWLVVRVISCIKSGRVDWRREARYLLLYLVLAVMVRFTFFPFPSVDGQVQPLAFDPDTLFPLRINIVPLKQIFWFETRTELLVNIIGNVAMYIPVGFILPIVYPNLDRFWKAVPAGVLISVCFELAQLPFASRATDVDDVILNTLGVIIGFAIFALARALRTRAKQAKQL